MTLPLIVELQKGFVMILYEKSHIYFGDVILLFLLMHLLVIVALMYRPGVRFRFGKN